jgi:16S rRNA (guanine527-N7)-methyltransferase
MSEAALTFPPEIAEWLIALGKPAPKIREKLLSFTEILLRWNTVHNLVSRKSDQNSIWSDHIMDALYAAMQLPSAAAIVDIGTGAGFPGVMLATVHAPTQVYLVEPRKKTHEFLHEVKRTLGLTEVTLFQDRIEAFKVPLDANVLFVSRAFSPFEKLFPAVAKVMGAGQRLAILGGTESPIPEAAKLGNVGLRLEEKRSYHPTADRKQLFLLRKQ